MSISGNDILTDVRDVIVEPNAAFFSDSSILTIINQAQRKYVAKTRVLQSFAFTSTIQGQNNYPMPTDWLGSEKVFYNATTDGVTPNWRPLEATSLEKLGQENPNFLSSDASTQAPPRKYYVIGSTLYLYPKPSSSGTNDIFMFYESKAPSLLTLDDTLAIDDTLYDGVYAFVLAKLLWKDGEREESKRWMSGDDRNPGVFELELGNGRKWKNKRILDGKWKLDIQSFIPFSYNVGTSGLTSGTMNPLNM